MAKVTILALTLGRTEMTRQTWQTNLNNAGIEYDLFWFDNGSTEDDMRELFGIAAPYSITHFDWKKYNTGISYALNSMIKLAFARGADYVMGMSNDIVEPDNWVNLRVEAAQAIPNTGVVAIPVQDSNRYSVHNVNGIRIDEGQVIGNFLITKKAFENVGLYCEDYFPYGPIDLDYCDRCNIAGLRTYYLSDYKADHLGYDRSKNPQQYEQDKKEALQVHWKTYKRNGERYRSGLDIYQYR